MKKLKKLLKKQGFTLVELIIVIAIIAVLAVAAFMMLTKWLGKSRDSRRLGDLGTIKKALEVTYSDTDRGLNMYPDPTDVVDVLDGSGVVMWNQGVFGLDTIAEMDNMQKAPKDPSDQNYYRYAVTLDKKEFQLGTILEDGNDVSIVGSVRAANGEARLDGNYDGYVSYPTTGGTMIFKTPSLLVNGEPKINVFSGDTNQFMVDGEEEGAEIQLRSVKTDGNTSVESVATALGIDEKSAAIVLKKETGAVVTVFEKEETPSTPSCDTNYSWDGSSCIADTKEETCGSSVPDSASASTSSTYNQTWDGNAWTPSLEWTEGASTCGFSCNENYIWNETECVETRKTCLEFKNAGHTENKQYSLDPDGDGIIEPFLAYCDMTGGGRTLIGRWDGTSTTQTEISSITDSFSLVENKVRAIAMESTDVRLKDDGYASDDTVFSTNSKAIEALQTGGNWHNGATFDGWDWTYSCSPTVNQWPNMYHACGNEYGVHWLAISRRVFTNPTSPTTTWIK